MLDGVREGHNDHHKIKGSHLNNFSERVWLLLVIWTGLSDTSATRHYQVGGSVCWGLY